MNATKSMAKKHSKKTEFLSSLLALLLCVAMLVGTTFAWFTDTVTSGDNLIVAGNLDLEVSYKNEKEDTDWTDLQGSESVFSQGLWEPGHTEYVTLKVHNAGTLALKYQINVSPISETGGINVSGASFKLSDYLVFKATEASETDGTPADRAAARALAGTETKLTQSALSNTNTILKDGADQYVTLVIYMPESVGNEANYKTGTTAPQIKLGITVLATQVEEENDSFGNTYDANAYTVLDKTVSYNYFPQVSVKGQVKVSGESSVAKGETAGNEVGVADNVVTVYSDAESNHENTIASVSVPVQPTEDAKEGNVGTVTLEVTKMDATSNGVTVNADQESTSYDVKTVIEGKIEKTTDGLYTVNMNIGAGKNNLTVTHVHESTTTAMTKVGSAGAVVANNQYYYDIDSGVLTMAVLEFSEFATVYDKPVCAIGTTAYGSLKAAVAAATTGETIVMCSDVEYPESSFELNGVNLDLNGHKIKVTRTANSGRNFNLFGNVTISNGTIEASLHVANACAIYGNQGSNVTLNNVNVKAYQTGTNNVAYGPVPFGGYMDNPNGTITINGGTYDCRLSTNGSTRYGSVTINSGTFNEDVYMAAYMNYNINGGTFNKNVEFRSGIININGGTFNNNGTPEYLGTEQDISIGGCSIGLVSHNGEIGVEGYGPNPVMTITGGTFAGSIGLYRVDASSEYPTVTATGVAVKTVELGKERIWTNYAANSFSTPVDENAKLVTINDAAELALFANTASTYSKDYTIKLASDIDLAGKLWTPISSFNATFDGNGKTISNMTVVGTDNLGLFGSTSGATIKNLTMDKASITGNGKNVGVVAADAGVSTFDGVKVTSADVNTTSKYAGGIAGTSSSTIKNCSVSDSKIKGKDQVGGLVGYQWCNGIWNCAASNNTVEATEERAGGIAGKMQMSTGNDSYFKLDNNTVSGGSATAPDYAGGLVAQIHGDTDKYEVKGNAITGITLSAPKKGWIGVFRPTASGSINETFINAAQSNVTENTYNGNSYNVIDNP